MTKTLATFPLIETERTVIKMIASDDDADALAAVADPSVIAIDNPRGLVAANRSGKFCCLGVWCQQGELIGSINMMFKGEADISIGYWLAANRQGQGYATDAVGAVVAALSQLYPHRRVIADTGRNNIRSLKLLERLDFVVTEEPARSPTNLLLALKPASNVQPVP